jgi:3-oxoacyl-[acyl-carrier-protein] synthase I
MKPVWYIGDAMMTPLGDSAGRNFESVVEGKSALRQVPANALKGTPAFFGSIFGNDADTNNSRFEGLCVNIINQLTTSLKPDPSRTLLILSTTKGNVDLLSTDSNVNLHLPAKRIGEACGYTNVIVVSNACISGVLAFIVGKRMLQAGKYDHAIIVGAEVLGQFIVSGFQSLHALSNEGCRPFDKDRKGINLGEGAGAVLLSVNPSEFRGEHEIVISGVSTSNDANHISGPSRTGEELAKAVTNALRSANLSPEGIDSICAHGTATIFNDEMEAKAFKLAGLASKPLYSLKGNFGHTLGAAGVIETIIARHSLLQGAVPASIGYETSGVTENVNVNRTVSRIAITTVLKTASGFGGCNAALILEKK